MWIGIRKAPGDDNSRKDLMDRLDAALSGGKGGEIKDAVKRRTEKPEGEKRTAEELRNVPVRAPTEGGFAAGGDKGDKEKGIEETRGGQAVEGGSSITGTEESEAMKQKRQEIYDRAIAQGNTPARAQALADAYQLTDTSRGKAPPPSREGKRVSEDKDRGASLGRGIGAKRATFDIEKPSGGRREKDIATEAGEGGVAGFGRETRVVDDTGRNPFMGSKKKGPKEVKTLESYLNSMMSKDPDAFQTQILGQDYGNVSRRNTNPQGVRDELIRRFGELLRTNKEQLAENIMNHMNRAQLQLAASGEGGSASMTGLDENVQNLGRDEFMRRILGEGRDVTQDPGFKQRVDPSAMEVTGISDEEKLSNLIDMTAQRQGMSPDDEQRLRNAVEQLQQQQGTAAFQMSPSELVERAAMNVTAGTDEALQQRNMANLRAQFSKLIAQENALEDMVVNNPSLQRRLSEIRDQRRMVESQIKGGAPPERAPQRPDKGLGRKQGEYTEVETLDGPRMKFVESEKTLDPTQQTPDLGMDPSAVGRSRPTAEEKANMAMGGMGMTEEEKADMLAAFQARMAARDDDDDEPPAPVATGFPMYIGDVLMKSVQNRLWWQGL